LKSTIKQLGYDSNEELYFDWWIEELIKIGLVKERIYHPKKFDLSGQFKRNTGKTMIDSCSYTTDYLLILNNDHEHFFKIFYPTFFELPHIKLKHPIYYQSIFSKTPALKTQIYSWIEIKPDVRNSKGNLVDPHNQIAICNLKRKWVLQNYKIFIQIIKPIELFRKTFYPINYLALKRKVTGKTIQDFLKISEK
jgi:hypothetical protein